MRFHTTYRFVRRIILNFLMEIRAVSDNLLLTTADYLGESDENGPQAIAVRTLEAIEEHWHDAHQTLPIDFRGRGEARATGNQGST